MEVKHSSLKYGFMLPAEVARMKHKQNGDACGKCQCRVEWTETYGSGLKLLNYKVMGHR